MTLKIISTAMTVGILALTIQAVAATDKTAIGLPVFEGNTEGVPSAVKAPYSKEAYAKEIAAAQKRATRKVAQSANYEAAMSPALKKLRSDILSIKNSWINFSADKFFNSSLNGNTIT